MITNSICPSCCSRYYRQSGSAVWIDIILCEECSEAKISNPELRNIDGKSRVKYTKAELNKLKYQKRRDPMRMVGP